MGCFEDELPILIQLEGRQDTLEFWSQQEALVLLQSQMLDAISDVVPARSIGQPLPGRRLPQTPAKFSMFGRKQSKAPIVERASVEVELDEVHFRSENEYGLFETHRARCVRITVDVR